MARDRVAIRDWLGQGAFSMTRPKRCCSCSCPFFFILFFFLELDCLEEDAFVFAVEEEGAGLSGRGRLPPASCIFCCLSFFASSLLAFLFAFSSSILFVR